MAVETRYYDILCVKTDASTEEISRAFKKIALTCHPDKTGRDPKLTEKFKDITRAYEVLKDERTRQVYNYYGEAGLDGTAADQQTHEKPSKAPLQPDCHFKRATNLFTQVFSDIQQHFNPMEGALNMHMNMINMMCPQARQQQQQSQQSQSQNISVTPVENPAINAPVRGNDIHHVCKVTLADLYFGKVVKFRLPKNSACTQCNGAGGRNPRLCRTCAGQGQVLLTMVNYNSQYQEFSTCRECSGTGVYIAPLDKCPANCAQGYVKDNKIIKANIFPGSSHNDRIVLQGEGDEGRNIIPGDVIIQLQQIPSNGLVRNGDNLFMEHDIDLKTALCGGKVLIQDFIKKGQDVEINVNVNGFNPESNTGEVTGVIQNGAPMEVKGYGMPINETSIEGTYFQNTNEIDDFADVIFDLKRYKRGNLYVKFNIVLPNLGDFMGGIEDFNILAKVLPSKTIESSAPIRLTACLSQVPSFNAQNCPLAAAVGAAASAIGLGQASTTTSGVTNSTSDGLRLPFANACKKLKKSNSFVLPKKQKYDYNDIAFSESDDDEKEDERYYSNEWEEDERRRKTRIDEMSDFVTT